MNFKKHKIEDLAGAVTKLIKRCKTMAEVTQVVLMGIAFDIQSNGSPKELNRFLRELSTVNQDGKLVTSAIARSVGVYMKSHLPLSWDNKEQVFILMEGDFDYEQACDLMEAVRWDKFNQKKADDEFDADKILQRAIGMIKGLLAKQEKGELKDDDPAFLTARKIAKAF